MKLKHNVLIQNHLPQQLCMVVLIRSGRIRWEQSY